MTTINENRVRLIEKLSGQIPTVIKDELDHALDVDREPEDWPNGYDIADAFEDAYSIADDNGDRRFLYAADTILIELGYYQPMTDEEIRNTVTTGRKKYDMKRGGVCYQVVAGMRDWIGSL